MNAVGTTISETRTDQPGVPEDIRLTWHLYQVGAPATGIHSMAETQGAIRQSQ